jgi:hypothetical protein
MKYKNFPVKPLGAGGMLHFVQQFRIIAGVIRKMLYFGQDYPKVIRPSPQPAVELAKLLRRSAIISIFTMVKGAQCFTTSRTLKTEHPALIRHALLCCCLCTVVL